MMEHSSQETMAREEMPRLEAFLHDDLVNEHSEGFSLNIGNAVRRRRRRQALTVKEEVPIGASIRVAPRESKLSSLVIIARDWGLFCILFYGIRKYTIHFENCPAPAPSPSRRFGPPNEVKERLHRSTLQRLSGLTKALALFYT